MTVSTVDQLWQDLELARADSARSPKPHLSLLCQLIEHLQSTNDHETAWPLSQEAVRLQMRLVQAAPVVTDTVQQLYQFCAGLRDPSSRVAVYTKLLETFNQPSADWPRGLAGLLNELAEGMYLRQQYDAAVACCKRALMILGGDLRAESTSMFRTRNNLACLHVARGQFPVALRLFTLNLQAVQRSANRDYSLLAVQYGNVGEAYRRQGKLSEAEQMLLVAIEQVKAGLGQDNIHVAHLLGLLAGVRADQGRYRAQHTLLKKVLTIRESLMPANHPIIGEALRNLAEASLHLGDHQEAERLLVRSLEILENADPPLPLQVALGLFHLGQTYLVTNRITAAECMFMRTISYYEMRHQNVDPLLAQTFNSLGVMHRARGQFDKARESHRRALEVQLAGLGERHIDVSETYLLLGDLDHAEGHLDAAIACYEKSFAIRENRWGTEHWQVAEVLQRRASIELEVGHANEALTYCRRAAEILGKLQEQFPLMLRDVWRIEADVQLALGNAEEAARLLEAAIDLQKKFAPSSQDSSLASGLMLLADAQAAANKFDMAEQLLEKSCSMLTRTPGRHSEELTMLVERFARLYLLKGDVVKAQSWMDRALADREKAFGRNSPPVLALMDEYAAILRNGSQFEAAAELEKRAVNLREASSHVLADLF